MNEQELIIKYLDGELRGEKEKEALLLIADDPGLRELLRFENQVRMVFKKDTDLSSFEVPEKFKERVMEHISKEQTVSDNGGYSLKDFLNQWKRRWADLTRPKSLRLRPVYALAMFVLLIGLALSPLYFSAEFIPGIESADQRANSLTMNVQEADAEEIMVRFVFIDEEAESVAIAGDFNDWESVPMTAQQINGKTVWTGLVSMAPGQHKYMFVKNGETWVTDPLASFYHEDGFGNKNAVINL